MIIEPDKSETGNFVGAGVCIIVRHRQFSVRTKNLLLQGEHKTIIILLSLIYFWQKTNMRSKNYTLGKRTTRDNYYKNNNYYVEKKNTNIPMIVSHIRDHICYYEYRQMLLYIYAYYTYFWQALLVILL